MRSRLQSELPKWFGGDAPEELVEHGLQVGVTGGGCSGLQYLLDFAKEPGEIDFSNEQHGVRVFIDRVGRSPCWYKDRLCRQPPRLRL